MSCKLRMLDCSNSVAVMAVTATGTNCINSARFRAVTMTSSSASFGAPSCANAAMGAVTPPISAAKASVIAVFFIDTSPVFGVR